jgi:ABC-2 type transport system ATP-binding protein
VLTVSGLRKRYGRTLALDGVDLTVAAGEVFGLLGPNGAGKTTTVECIVGLVEPDEGELRLEGAPIDRAALRGIGIAMQGPSLPDAITPMEAVRLFAGLYSVEPDLHRELATAGLADKRDARYATLSGGQKQRLNLALALLHDPRLVLLDEPTAGLDPLARADLASAVRALAAEGRAVLMTTHDLGEAERVCDRLALLARGRIVATGTPAELLGAGSALTFIEGEASIVLEPGDEGLGGMEIDGRRFRCRTEDPTGTVQRIAAAIQSRGGTLLALRVGQARLEDVILERLARTAE